MLETLRLKITEVTFDDLEKVHELNSLPETDEFNTLGIPESIDVTEKIMNDWIIAQQQKLSHTFSIYRKDSGQFIGMAGMKFGKPNYRTAEIWYKLHKDFWRNGYATETVKGLLSYGFNELKLHRIEAGCAVENMGSIRVLEKSGMIREGRTRKKLPIRGEWKDNYFYAILEEDWDYKSQNETNEKTE